MKSKSLPKFMLLINGGTVTKKRTKAMLSLLLALCMLLSVTPWAVPIVAVEPDSPANDTAAEGLPSEAVEDTPSIVEEDVSLRGEYEKHYLMSDGSYQAVVYSYPVHELVDGVWVEIETTNPLTRGSVTTDTERTNIIDNFVLQGAGVQDRNLDRLYIGNRSAGLTRAFIRFATMPTLPSGAIIIDATMSLTLTNGTDTASNASAYMVTGGTWTSGEIQWSTMPAADTLLQSNISHNDCTGYTFSCLTATQHWYTGDTTGQNENYGIMLRYYDETVDDYNAVYSADCTDENKRPTLTIVYTPVFVNVEKESGYLFVGYTQNATCTTSPSGLAVTWSSSNPDVATVNNAGIITGVAHGSATITATYCDSVLGMEYSDSVNVNVRSSCGLRDETQYYIMNYDTSYLLSLELFTDTDYTNVCTRQRASYPASMWTLEEQNDGRFQLINGISTTGKVLHVSGSNLDTYYLDIYTDLNTDNEKFTIYRIPSGTYAGLYYIQYGTYFVSQDESNNIILTTSPSNKSIWSFFATQPGYADIFSHDYHYTDASNVEHHFDTSVNDALFNLILGSALGYTANATTNGAATNAFNTLSRNNQQIFVFRGHGEAGILGFFEEGNISTGGIYADEAIQNVYIVGTDRQFISDLSHNALTDLRCVLYLGCNTGGDITQNGITYNSVNVTFEKGAHFVLGTTASINNSQGNSWLKFFLNHINNGESIGEALDNANDEFGSFTLTNEDGTVTNIDGLPIYYIGDDRQYPGPL